MKKLLPDKRGPIANGAKIHTGRDLGAGLPVIIQLAIPGMPMIPTYWSPNDAEGIAWAILKQVEICRRWKRESPSVVNTPSGSTLAETRPVPV